jgi:hypothetical protein
MVALSTKEVMGEHFLPNTGGHLNVGTWLRP